MLLVQEFEKIAAQIAEGNTEAENYLFSRLRDKIQFLVRIRLKKKIPVHEQEDIISEIQKAVLISLRKGDYNPSLGKPLEAYIAGIAGNIVAQDFRKMKKEKGISNIDLLKNIPAGDSNLSNLINQEKNEKLKMYLSKLKPKYREVLLLRIYEDQSIEEISQKLKIEKRRVSERINYAFKLFLKECKRDKYFQYFED